MIRPATLTTLLLAALATLVLLAPSASSAEEATPPSTGAETTTTTPAQETTTTTPAPQATAPAAPTPPPTESTPAPTTSSTGAAAPPTPQVSTQSAQGATPSRPAAPSKAGGKSKAGGADEKPANGGAAGKPKRGKRAPKPSALTPPLPLSLSSSIAGVPAFFIESFRIPPFLLPIYQAAGTAYGVPWQLLAAINEVETDYGRDLNVSSAGAEGWMQFLPSSWATYGVDANGDGFKDPYNPADAIFAAARYLRAAGAATSLRGAVFSYNHSQAYVESVMLRAKLLGGTPSGLLGAITGLTEARFPVHAKAHFSDGFATLAPDGSGGSKTLAGTTIYAEANAPVIAVQDGAGRADRRLAAARALRLPARRLREHVHVRQAGQRRAALSRAQATRRTAARARTTQKADEAAEPRPTGPASAGTQAGAQPPASEGAATSALSLGSSSALEAAAPGTTSTPQPGAGSAPVQSAPPETAAAARHRRSRGRRGLIRNARHRAGAVVVGHAARLPRRSQRRVPARTARRRSA